MMNLLKALLRPTALAGLGVVALCATILVGGTMLRNTEGGDAQVWLQTPFLVLLCLFVLLAAAFVWMFFRMQTATRSMLIEESLKRAGRDQVESARPDQRDRTEAVHDRFQEGLEALRTSGLGKGALYSLPWYVIIGPPGSGKTTMLHESGLTFLLDHKRGIRGIGGTRNCDWFFTQEGILLDTAGRYATEVEDHDEWLGFIGLLKNARRGKALNGVIVAMSVGDLVLSTSDEVDAHAERIRQRIDELSRELELALPVYLLFTKADLVEGFVEFFGDLDRAQRSQIWGATFDLHDARPADRRFADELDDLEHRLEVRRTRLLALDNPLRRHQRTYSFPIQFRTLRSRLLRFLEMVVQPNPYYEPARLRGVYFTSGTQEGNPIDQVMANMRQELGLPEADAEDHREDVPCNSYFIESLFRDVVFEDRNVASESLLAQTRQRRRRTAGLVTCAALAVLGIGGLWVSHGNAVEAVSSTRPAIASAVKTLQDHRSAPLHEDVLTALDTLDDVGPGGHLVAGTAQVEPALDGHVDAFVKDRLWPALAAQALSSCRAAAESCQSHLVVALDRSRDTAERDGATQAANADYARADKVLAQLDRLARGERDPVLEVDLELGIAGIAPGVRARLATTLARRRAIEGEGTPVSLLDLDVAGDSPVRAAFDAQRETNSTLHRALKEILPDIEDPTPPDPDDATPPPPRGPEDTRADLRRVSAELEEQFFETLHKIQQGSGTGTRGPREVLNDLATGLKRPPGDKLRVDWLRWIAYSYEAQLKQPRSAFELDGLGGLGRKIPDPPPLHRDHEKGVIALVDRVRAMISGSGAVAEGSGDGPLPAQELLDEIERRRADGTLGVGERDAETSVGRTAWDVYKDADERAVGALLDLLRDQLLADVQRTVAIRWDALKARVQAAYALYPFERTAADSLDTREFTELFGPKGEVTAIAAVVERARTLYIGEEHNKALAVSAEFDRLAAWSERVRETFYPAPDAEKPSLCMRFDGDAVVQGVRFPDAVPLGHVFLTFAGSFGWDTDLPPTRKSGVRYWDPACKSAELRFAPLSDADESRLNGENLARIDEGPWSLFRLFDDFPRSSGPDHAREIRTELKHVATFGFPIPGSEPQESWSIDVETYTGGEADRKPVHNPLKVGFFETIDLPDAAISRRQ